MSAPRPTTIRTRAARSLSPALLARSTVLAVLAIVAAPLLAMIGVLVFGLAAGASLTTTPTGALAQAIGINVILYGSAVLAVLIGVLAIAQLHSGTYTKHKRPLRRAVAGAFATLPRLIGALAVLVIVGLTTLLAWAPIVVAALLLAVVLFVRYRRSTPALVGECSRTSPGVRRALIWAIPFLPLVAALAAIIALFPACLARPRSVRALLRTVIDRVRTQKRALLLLVVAVAPVSAALTWAATTVATAVQAGATDATSGGFIAGTLILAGSLALLIIVIGASIAVLSPPATTGQADAAARPARQRSRYADFLRRATPVMRRTAMVTVLALCSTLVATPAFAAESAAATPTEMAVYQQNEARLGNDMTFIVRMTSSGTAVDVTGSIEVYSGTTLLATTNAEYLAWWVYVPTTDLQPGTNPLRFVYVPTGDFAGSENTVSVELGKAFTNVFITATPSWNETITWGDSHSIVANVTGELDGPRTLVVRDGIFLDSPIAASVDFTITEGAATVTLDLTRSLGTSWHSSRRS